MNGFSERFSTQLRAVKKTLKSPVGVRQWLYLLRHTPFHPQWFAFRRERERYTLAAKRSHGRVLDVGCSQQAFRAFLRDGCEYVGLDHPATGINLYGAKPQILADACALPIVSGAFDTVVLLEVLEHLPEPEKAIREAVRVVKSSGHLIVSVPFMYPIHDAPGDYHRWTRYGLRDLLANHGLDADIVPYGASMHTAAVLTNVAFADLGLSIARRNRLGVLLYPFIATMILAINIGAWLLGMIRHGNEFMPLGYSAVAYKGNNHVG